MLEHTFCHIPRLSAKSESAIWNAGVHSWRDVFRDELPKIPRVKWENIRPHLEDSSAALHLGNARYFADLLPTRDHWRLFPHFRHSIAYLDIETTGLRVGQDAISVVSIFDGKKICTYIQGENLRDFELDIAQYDVLVTFNGKSFDLPFLHASLGIEFPQVHIDLCHVLRRFGMTGGLKKCERRLGIRRGELDGIDGFMAVALWKDYTRRYNPRALDTLLSYNVEDVIHLETLMVTAYNLGLKSTPFEEKKKLTLPKIPMNPHRPDPETVYRLKREMWWKFEDEQTA